MSTFPGGGTGLTGGDIGGASNGVAAEYREAGGTEGGLSEPVRTSMDRCSIAQKQPYYPGAAARGRIAREMRERRYAQFVTQRPKGAPFSRVMRGERLTGDYPLVRWSREYGSNSSAQCAGPGLEGGELG